MHCLPLRSWIIACKENHLNIMNAMLLLFTQTRWTLGYDEVILNSITTNKAFYILIPSGPLCAACLRSDDDCLYFSPDRHKSHKKTKEICKMSANSFPSPSLHTSRNLICEALTPRGVMIWKSLLVYLLAQISCCVQFIVMSDEC